jgi:serine-type D-Ala-D-Ala carboxypeptidase (penicillin-binding protein 5/6)
VIVNHRFGTTTYYRHRAPAARWRALRLVLAVVTLLAAAVTAGYAARSHLVHPVYGPPGLGQASYRIAGQDVVSSSGQQPVPIASLAKVMTAYLVLRDHPLDGGDGSLGLTVTAADVADTERRAGQDESIVRVAAGETLTERQALAALLLPSANNVAAMLARAAAGSSAAFVARMNDMADALDMRHTSYTDPSGFDEATRSTAADQLVLAQQAMRLPDFAALVALPSYELPVAGTVHNTNRLLGREGFVGIKTGSDGAAGGCFMFRAHRSGGDVTGVVLGRSGHDLIGAALQAARELVESVA